MSSTNTIVPNGSRAAQEVAHHPGFVAVGRVGWVAKGVVYGLVGILAVQIALQEGGSDSAADAGQEEASQMGAVAEIADRSYGTPLLWAIAIGLLLYGAWRLVSAALPAEHSAKAWATRAGYLASAVLYVTLGWTAIGFALRKSGAGSESEDSRIEHFTRDLMERSAGRWLVGLLGVGVIAVAALFVVKGATASFRDELEPRDVGAISHENIVTLGRVGWIGRGVVTGLVGWLLIRAAVMFRPDEAQGIDGALRQATTSGLGAVLVGLAAIALVVYGIFCIVSAPRQLLKPAD